MTDEPSSDFPPGAFARLDEDDDEDFYAPPRLVTHIDDSAIAALREFYARQLTPGMAVLDLMSSWVSHLPGDLMLSQVIGHGMNERELAANPQLTCRFVQNLNRSPNLPIDDGALDAAMCCVSVQYLQDPIAVFAEVRRVLKPAAPFIVSYSNRCFPSKAVAVWRALDTRSHATLIHRYFTLAGFGEISVDVLANGMHGDPLIAVTGRA